MRFSTVAILFGAAASASASLLARQSLPACSISCTTSADLGGCALTDTKCLCTSPAFIASTTKCIQSTCQGDDLQSALTAAQQLCAAVGVTLSSAAPSSTEGGASSTSAGSSGSSTAASTTSGSSPTSTTPSGTSGSSTGAPASTSSTAAAMSNGANTIFGLAAAGLVALAL